MSLLWLVFLLFILAVGTPMICELIDGIPLSNCPPLTLMNMLIIIVNLIVLFILYKLFKDFKKRSWKAYAPTFILFFVLQIAINVFLNEFEPIKKVLNTSINPFVDRFVLFLFSSAIASFLNASFIMIFQKNKEKNIIISEESKYLITKFEYYREILGDIPPALLYFIYNTKLNYKNQIVSTLIYLEEKDVIIIENGTVLIKNNEYIFSSHERLIIDFVTNKITKKEFNKNFKKSLLKDLESKNFIKEKNEEFNASVLMQFVVLWVIFVSLILMAVLFSISKLGFLMVVGYVLVFIEIPIYEAIINSFHPLIRTQEALELCAKMNGLKSFLKDFSIMKDRYISEVKVYEDYIIYSIIFKFRGNLMLEAHRLYDEVTGHKKHSLLNK